jgi:hypothetical protein
MIFYSLSDSTFTRPYSEEIEMAFSALDCVLNDEKAIYASAELTSGRQLYAALHKFQVKSSADLEQLKGKDWYAVNIRENNVKSAQGFAADIRKKVGKTLVISPAPFSARDWTQPEYLAFWEQLLRTRVSSSWFKSDWQYSNGCTFEFAVSVDAGVKTCDHQGNLLTSRKGAELIESAIRDLESSDFDTAKLRENLSRLQPVSART